MRKDTITVRLPDGYKLEISRFAKKQEKKVGARYTLTDVVIAALKKFIVK